MKKTRQSSVHDDDMRDEYDFSNGVRNKYAGRFPRDCVMVVLEPDVAKMFPTAKRVNAALRALGAVVKSAKVPA